MIKKLIYFLLTFFCIIVIYFNYNHKVYNYVSLSDNKVNGYNQIIKNTLNNHLLSYNDLFICNNINQLIMDIRNNKTIRYQNNDYYLKKMLRESSILVIFLGEEELTRNYDKYDYHKNYYYMNRMYLKIENLILEIKKYAKEKIFFIGYYNPTDYYDSKTDELFYEMDKKLETIMHDHQIIYLSIYEIVKNDYKNSKMGLNNSINQQIAQLIQGYLS